MELGFDQGLALPVTWRTPADSNTPRRDLQKP
jgi:hypothetical protein